MGSDYRFAYEQEIMDKGPTAIHQRDKIKTAVETWLSKQGHDQCHYYPDIFREIVEILELPVPKTTLLSRSEFESGCRRFQNDIYKGKSP